MSTFVSEFTSPDKPEPLDAPIPLDRLLRMLTRLRDEMWSCVQSVQNIERDMDRMQDLEQKLRAIALEQEISKDKVDLLWAKETKRIKGHNKKRKARTRR